MTIIIVVVIVVIITIYSQVRSSVPPKLIT